MQQRTDRDEYITVHTENLVENEIVKFTIIGEKYSKTYGLPYDYASLMHFGSLVSIKLWCIWCILNMQIACDFYFIFSNSGWDYFEGKDAVCSLELKQ